MSQDQILNKSNWQQLAIGAIEELPDSLTASIGYSQTPQEMTITIAVEPMDDGEADVNRISIKWFEALRDLRAVQQHETAQADWPIVSVESPAMGCEQSFFAERADVGSFQGHVQLAILEEFYCGGADSMVTKDEEGIFFTLDGTQILKWQSDEHIDDDDDI